MMNINTKFNNIALVEQGLILKYQKKEDREISFSEIENIYIKTNKLKPAYELGLILSPFLLIYFSLQYLSLEKVIFVSLTAFIPVYIKINNHKNCWLFICLKNGTVLKKKLSLNTKKEYFILVNAVRKKQLSHFAKHNAHKLDSLDFYQNQVS